LRKGRKEEERMVTDWGKVTKRRENDGNKEEAARA